MAESSNTATGNVQNESTTKSTSIDGTSKSTGNFSGGTGGFSLGNDLSKVASSLSNSLLPNVSFSNNTPGANKNDFSFGSNVGWIPTVSAPGSESDSSGSTGSTTNVATGATYNSSTGSTTVSDKSALEKILKVDDVWSTDSSDSSTESPKVTRTGDTESGDYQASSNEKSEVKTGTFGKQSDIVTNPTLTSENKGLVDNSTIESVEGIVTKQKDKASQEVLDASKKRNNAESEDKTDRIKNQLNANDDSSDIKSPTNSDYIDPAYKAEDDKRQNDLNIKQQNVSNKQNELNQKKQELKAAEEHLNTSRETVDYYTQSVERLQEKTNKALQSYQKASEALVAMDEDKNPITRLFTERSKEFKDEIAQFNKISEENGLGITIPDNAKISDLVNLGSQIIEGVGQKHIDSLNIQKENLANANETLRLAEGVYKEKESEVGAAQNDYNNAQNDYNNTQKEYNAWKASNTAKAPETTPEPTVETEVVEEVITEATPETLPETPAAEENSSSLQDAANNLRQTYQGEEWAEEGASRLEDLNDSQIALQDAIVPIAEKGLENCTSEEINKYIEAQKEYNNNLKSALNNGRAYEQHDFNKDFVRSVAKANDFDVTLPDGSKIAYSDFATDMVVKSPKIAEAMYESKANQYEADGRKILATIERAKAKIVQTFIGSKLTFADNKVRDQFNQMADTNMRATYAAYNNVLKDPNASDADKAEASTQISQAQSLKTASTALKASTGFLSGIGDSTSDGVYGAIDPSDLNVYQETLNGIKAFSQVALGLGVSPAANKAYQNLYYLNKDYLNGEGSILAKDFDKDGFAWVEEYGNNAAAGMILAGGELATGIALMFNPTTVANGTNLILDSIQNFVNSLYGVRGNAVKASNMTEEILSYFEEAKTLNGLPKEATDVIDNAIVQIENFELKADEVANLDNWLEGSGSNTADNNKFNQSLTYDEWLKLIESDETLRNYAKQLIDKKKEEKV